jgi:imidazolonepropionase-like amidohydrolase
MMLATFLVLALGGGDVALRADKVWIDGSNSIDKGMVLVRDGRIVEVGAKLDLDEGVQVVECQGHLTAGLVALRAQVGVAGAALDPTRAALPEARVAHALRRDDPAFADLRAQGITAVVVAPDAAKLLPGATAVAKTTGALVSERAHLSVVFGASALSANREPTSYARQGEARGRAAGRQARPVADPVRGAVQARVASRDRLRARAQVDGRAVGRAARRRTGQGDRPVQAGGRRGGRRRG